MTYRWQSKRKYMVDGETLNELDYEARLVLGEMINSGFLLYDVKIDELRNDYLYGLFDALYKSKLTKRDIHTVV